KERLQFLKDPQRFLSVVREGTNVRLHGAAQRPAAGKGAHGDALRQRFPGPTLRAHVGDCPHRQLRVAGSDSPLVLPSTVRRSVTTGAPSGELPSLGQSHPWGVLSANTSMTSAIISS